jgi:SdrD B-like domain
VYDLDAGGDVTVKMDYRLNPGSGGGDVVVLIPESAFAGQTDSAFVYLYSQFGATWAANAGFEEWAVRMGTGGASTPPPPPPQLSSLSGYVYFDGDKSYDRTADDSGIAGIVILLQGTDDLGQLVSRTLTTDANGYYEFTDLRPGTYSIIESVEPPGAAPDAYYFADGVNTVGSLGGTNNEFDGLTSPVTPDAITGIVVGAGVQGTNYNFGEWSEGLIKLR